VADRSRVECRTSVIPAKAGQFVWND